MLPINEQFDCAVVNEHRSKQQCTNQLRLYICLCARVGVCVGVSVRLKQPNSNCSCAGSLASSTFSAKLIYYEVHAIQLEVPAWNQRARSVVMVSLCTLALTNKHSIHALFGQLTKNFCLKSCCTRIECGCVGRSVATTFEPHDVKISCFGFIYLEKHCSCNACSFVQ